jgi:hypothetical protein
VTDETVSIAGVPIRVVSTDDAERAHVVICGDASMSSPFADDIVTACAWCGTGIRHRPHAPKAPVKVCMACAFARMSQERDH